MPKSKKNKNLIETELKQRKEDIIKIDDLIKRVNFCHKDKWTPVPIYSPDSKIYKNEKRTPRIRWKRSRSCKSKGNRSIKKNGAHWRRWKANTTI